MTYVEDETVMDRLDLGYGPGNWQLQVEPIPYVEGAVKVRLGVRETGEWTWYEDFGYPNREGGESLKEAVSDGIRRCGRFVGIARDLYRKAPGERRTDSDNPVAGAPRIASDRRTHTGHRDGNPGAAGDRETGEVRDEPFEATVEGKVTYSNKAPVDGNFRQTPAGLMWGFVVEAEDKKRLQVVAGGGLAEALQAAIRVEALKGAWVTVHGLVERVPWEKDGKKMPPYQRMALRRIETPEFTLPAPVALSQELADAEAAADMLSAERQPEEGA